MWECRGAAPSKNLACRQQYTISAGRRWDARKAFFVGKFGLRGVFFVSKLGLPSPKNFPYLRPGPRQKREDKDLRSLCMHRTGSLRKDRLIGLYRLPTFYLWANFIVRVLKCHTPFLCTHLSTLPRIEVLQNSNLRNAAQYQNKRSTFSYDFPLLFIKCRITVWHFYLKELIVFGANQENPSSSLHCI